MDWMSTNPKMLESEWDQILKHANPEGTRFLYRSASKSAQFVKDTNVVIDGENTSVGKLLEYDTDTAERLHKVDRVHTYTSFFIADLKN